MEAPIQVAIFSFKIESGFSGWVNACDQDRHQRNQHFPSIPSTFMQRSAKEFAYSILTNPCFIWLMASIIMFNNFFRICNSLFDIRYFFQMIMIERTKVVVKGRLHYG